MGAQSKTASKESKCGCFLLPLPFWGHLVCFLSGYKQAEKDMTKAGRCFLKLCLFLAALRAAVSSDPEANLHRSSLHSLFWLQIQALPQEFM